MIYFAFQSALWTFLILLNRFRLQRSSLPFQVGWNLTLIFMLAGFFGARLTHILYESPQVYLQNPLQAFRFWEGGFVYDGGFFASLLAAWIYLKKEKESFFEWADFFAPLLAIGYSLGRIGCFLAGCCYGQYCDAPWAIEHRHPTQLYAFLTEGVLAAFLLVREKRAHPRGLIFSIWMVGHGLGRILMENFRDDFRGAFWLGVSPATWVGGFLALVGIGTILKLEMGPK